MQRRRTMSVLVGLCLLAGCSSQRVLVGPRPPLGYRTGEETVTGSGCGILIAGLIPAGVNTRTQRAYDRALAGRGTGLTDTKIQYSWYVIPAVGLMLCTDVEGKVIQ